MALTEVQRTLYQTRLDQAEEAMHNLMTGTSARVVVDQNGERIEYTVARTNDLRAYIMQLKSMLGLDLGIIGPAQPWFLR